MISIITSAHNQLGMNKLFVAYIKKYATCPYELIVVDNNSTDGSYEFFQQHADVVIRNEKNYSYPYCQNQGLQAARYECLAFLNNDLLVSYKWDEHILHIMQEQNLDIVSFATNDNLESVDAQKKINRKWKRIKYPLRTLFGTSTPVLRLMAYLTYGNWNAYCKKRYESFGNTVMEGFSGSCIMMNRKCIDKIGVWDTTMQGADFDIYNRSKVRSIEQKDMRPIHIALGIYFHHYQRLTIKSRLMPFADQENLKSIEEKWGTRAQELIKDIIT